mmetsp:Transcript_36538/g.58946  ORF Transcript_36538/g.58946 Transcript_36538/m.58946 type:complete len:197 (+) Transcript_36538:43-633(+)
MMTAAPLDVMHSAALVVPLSKLDFPDVQVSLLAKNTRGTRGARGLYRDAALKEWTLCDPDDDDAGDDIAEEEWLLCDGAEDLCHGAATATLEPKPSYAHMALKAAPQVTQKERLEEDAQDAAEVAESCATDESYPRNGKEWCRSAAARRAKKAAKRTPCQASGAASECERDGDSGEGFMEVRRKANRCNRAAAPAH